MSDMRGLAMYVFIYVLIATPYIMFSFSDAFTENNITGYILSAFYFCSQATLTVAVSYAQFYSWFGNF